MKGKFESVNSTIFHVMQRMCFGFVQKLKKKKKEVNSMSVENFKKSVFMLNSIACFYTNVFLLVC